MPKRCIDLRSDTVTQPTLKMREAMMYAEVGDDCAGEDPTVNRLQSLAAQLLGKQAALFVPTGTMGNNVAVLTHTNAGNTIILDSEAHIYYYECGAISALGGVMPITINSDDGCPNPDQVEFYLQRDPIRFPKIGLICLENTHNRRGGRAVPLEQMRDMQSVAIQYEVPVHLDGARIFNAAHALGTQVKDIADCADSVSFCLSKGLSAPVGSLLVGSSDFIENAIQVRRRLGGGMRQSGVIAAAGIIALTEMTDRLVEDHENAQYLAKELAEIDSLELDQTDFDTNMVVVNVQKIGMTAPEFVRIAREHDIRISYLDQDHIRLVTNCDVNRENIEYAADILVKLIRSIIN
ncbi:low-specificity L-threonine aldolase [Candidatus Poribacteria bacterium]|nr:low-specificity L-threonine aldolase [Candidatus Poribacteria bacterium]